MASGGQEQGPQEVRLSEEAIEELVQLVIGLVGQRLKPAPPRGMMSAAEVAQWFGVERSWVYAHAEELGARRLGFGERPRLRFDPAEAGARIEALGESGRRPGPGLRPIAGDSRPDSLLRRSRAMVVGQSRKRPGRRANAPRPGADLGAWVSNPA